MSAIRAALELMVHKAGKQNWNDKYPEVMEQAKLALALTHDSDPTVPEGFEPLEAFYNPTTGVLFLHGPLDDEDESHDCDLMGCGSVTPHVTYFGPLPVGFGDEIAADVARGNHAEKLAEAIRKTQEIPNWAWGQLYASVEDTMSEIWSALDEYRAAFPTTTEATK